MPTFRTYIMDEMTKFTKNQKDELNHFILNILMNPETARLLKKTKIVDADDITISKKDAKSILNNLTSIRQFILDLPREEED
jgi:hypothetical protein